MAAPSVESTDVCVVGAGVAGLSCALRLAAAGLRVTVVDARLRVGGRTMTVGFAGGSVDVGGQWLGPSQVRALKLVKDLGLELEAQTWFEDMQASPADPLLRSGSERNITVREASELRSVAQIIDDQARALTPPPWSADERGRLERLDRISAGVFITNSSKSEVVRRELGFFVNNTLACEPEEVSFLFFLNCVAACGGLWRLGDGDGGAQSYTIQGGAGLLSKRLAAAVEAAGGRLVLGCPVTGVTQAGGGVTVAAVGRTFTARAAVVAMAPTLWQKIAFAPRLPPIKAGLATRMFMGSVVKVIAVYDAPFWHGGAANGAELEETGPVYNLFPGRVGARHSLVGLIAGHNASEVGGKSAAEVRRLVTIQYATYFGEEAALTPVAFVSKAWSQEEWSGGCFEALAPPGVCIDLLEHGDERAGRLWWAATEFGRAWPGYIEGALESGERTAGAVAAALRAETAEGR